jgi:hypothetical protein
VAPATAPEPTTGGAVGTVVALLSGPVTPVELDPLAELPDERVLGVTPRATLRDEPRLSVGTVADLRRVRRSHVRDPRVFAEALRPLLAQLADEHGPLVLLPLDRFSTKAVHLLRGDRADTLAVTRAEAAVRVLAMLDAGRTLADIRHPVPLSLTDAGAQVVSLGASTDGWLTLGPSDAPPHLTVDPEGLEPPAVAAIGTRARLAAPRQRDTHLLIAPANYAGQGWAWARAARRNLGVEARNVAVYSDRARLRFDADVTLSAAQWWDPVERMDLALTEVLPATHVLLEAMRPVLGTGAFTDAGWSVPAAVRDVAALRASGREVALLFHGSEVRRPREHAAGPGWTPFRRVGEDAETERLAAVTHNVLAAAAELDVPRFVSTPDLLDHVPDAVWLPVALLPRDFAPAPPPFERDRPVVLHAPSSSRLKGSAHVDLVLRELDARGVVEYRRLADVPPMLMPGALRDVDVVVDQVVLGNPGVLAAQALAAGRLVVAHLPAHVRGRFPVPPPVVEATPLTLRSVLLEVLADRPAAAALAAEGPPFARQLHDGRASAAVLAAHFLPTHMDVRPDGGAR